jgi:hypothetical protein
MSDRELIRTHMTGLSAEDRAKSRTILEAGLRASVNRPDVHEGIKAKLAILDEIEGVGEEPFDIDEAVLDIVREDRRIDWEESHADEAERADHLDIPLIEMVWDAAWSAALEARSALGSQS